MQITGEVCGARITAHLAGELDHHCAAETRQSLEALIAGAPRATRLELELSHVTFMDSSGLGVILGRYRTMTKRGGGMALTGANRQVDRILRMAGVYALCDGNATDGGIDI